MNQKTKLAIFDLDGTLFDTKDVNFRSYSEALTRCGYYTEIDYKYYCEYCNGNNYKVFLPKIVNGITPEKMETVHKMKKDLYKENLLYAVKNEHLFRMIQLMREVYCTAVVTTASRQNTMDILNAFAVVDMFDLFITQEDVEKTKPDPECFFLAMQQAGVEAEDTIIFEDSVTGLEAAQKSGAHYVKMFGFN